jgi:hypothetical protein
MNYMTSAAREEPLDTSQNQVAARHAVIAFTPDWWSLAKGYHLGTEGEVEVRSIEQGGGRRWTQSFAFVAGAAWPTWRTTSSLRRRLRLANLFIELLCLQFVDPAVALREFGKIREFDECLPAARKGPLRPGDPYDPWLNRIEVENHFVAPIRIPEFADGRKWWRHGDAL